jgi:hypothetical protein
MLHSVLHRRQVVTKLTGSASTIGRIVVLSEIWLVICLVLLGASTSAKALAGPLSNASNQGQSIRLGPPPPRNVGTYATFQCSFGTINLAGTQVCDEQVTSPIDECVTTPSCTYSLVKGSMKSGTTFNHWKVTGEGSVQSSTNPSTNVTFDYPSTGVYSAEVYECPQTPVISSVHATPRGGFEEYWINWTDPTVFSTTFQWGTTTSYGLPGPEALGTSINLNELNSSTTYYYKITDVDNCGDGSSYTGTFTTSAAPTNAFVGWILTRETATPYQVMGTGPVPSGAVFQVGALCNFYNYYGYVNFSVGANSTGYYDLPIPATYSIYENEYPGYTLHFEIYSNGTCASWSTGNWIWGNYYTSNSEYQADADAQGYWNETRVLSSTLSSLNDYQEFLITPNTVGNVTLGLALLDRGPGITGTIPAQCGFDYDAGVSSTIQNSLGGNSASSTYGSETSWGASDAGWGVDTGIETEWDVSGVLNDTLNPSTTVEFSYPVNWADTWAASPSTTTDWKTLPNYTGQSPPSPWIAVKIPSSYTASNPDTSFLSITKTASFSSTSGIDLTVDVGVNFDFVSVGTSVELSYTNTVTYSSTSTLSCEVYDPNPGSHGDTAVFWYYEDGGSTSDIVHLALEGYCGGTSGNNC